MMYTINNTEGVTAMVDQSSNSKRYFWKSYELNESQYRAIRSVGIRDTFVETETHKRSEEFIRKAWK